MRVALALVALVLLPLRTMAQERFHFDGSLSVAEVYDDNLFSRAEARERDDVLRLSPRVSLSRRWPRLMLGAHYRLDAERYRRHRSLDTPLAAQDGSLELDWAVSRRVAASVTASYAEAQAPGGLNTLTGLEVGRRRGRRLRAVQSLSWQMGARTKAKMEQGFTREEVTGEPRTDTVAVSVGLERRMGPADTGLLSYRGQRFASEAEAILAHVVTLGWSRAVTPSVRLECEAGPRMSGRTVGAEMSASVKGRFPRGEVGLGYVNTQTTVIGEPGPVTAKGVTATFSRRLLASLGVAGGAAVFQVQGRGPEATVERLDVELAWRLTRRLSLAASHQLSIQRGGLGLERGQEIAHNTFMLRAVASSAGNGKGSR